jgi:arylsulfatase
MNRRHFLQTAAAFAASPAGRPNILFLFPDQLRYDWIGTNPHVPVRTPNLNRLAARGVNFRHAVVASPLCAPSRACLAVGKEYDRCGVPGNGENLPLASRTYYALLRDSGYHVTGCGKFDLAKRDNNQGLDGKKSLREWGFSDGINNAGKHDAMAGAKEPKDPYMAYLQRRGLIQTHVDDFHKRKGYTATFPTPLPEDAYCDNWLSQNGLDLLKAAPAGKPWHLMVNFTGPHPPMDITARMENSVRGRDFPQPNGSTEYDAKTHVLIRENYAAMIENIDRWVGAYLDAVRQRGELDNTLVVFSSDHGEMLGDHNLWGKVKPFQPSVGVPLIVAGPGVARGVSSQALVSMMDLAATYLDYAGVPRPGDMDSRSLRPLLEGRTRKHRDYVLSGLAGWRMVNDGRYKLIRGYGKETLLYDMQTDPLENTNIAAKAQADVRRLEKLL